MHEPSILQRWRRSLTRKDDLRHARDNTRHIAKTIDTDAKAPLLDAVAIDVLLRMYEENTEQGRHTESERSAVTTFVLGASAAITAFVCSKELSTQFRWVTLAVPLLGLYGLVMTLKLYERYDFHMKRARAFRYRIEVACSSGAIRELREASRLEQRLEHPLLEAIRLHAIWIVFNALVVVSGAVLAASILGRP